ncbi:MAG TPA: hypothetical protein DCZ40_08110 [Lachnospiraceae bacterium]|nr:hypothetical protein [Lachnospiraceae bacterium]
MKKSKPKKYFRIIVLTVAVLVTAAGVLSYKKLHRQTYAFTNPQSEPAALKAGKTADEYPLSLQAVKGQGMEEISFYLACRDKGIYQGDLATGKVSRIADDIGAIADVKGAKYLLSPKKRTARGTAVMEYDADQGKWETIIQDMGEFFPWTDGNYEQLADNFRYVPESDDISFTINIGLQEYNANPDETKLYIFNRKSGEAAFQCKLPAFPQERFYAGVYSWGENRNILYLHTKRAIYEYRLDTGELKQLDNSGYLEERMPYYLMQDGKSAYYIIFSEDEGGSGKGTGILRRYWFDTGKDERIGGEIAVPETGNIDLLSASLKASEDGQYILVNIRDDTRFEAVEAGEGSYTTADLICEYLYLIDAKQGKSYRILEYTDNRYDGIRGFFWKQE